MHETTIQTKRLELRPFKPSDSERLAKIINNINISYMCYRIPYPYTIEAAEAWLCARESDENERTWAITLKNDPKLIGGISLLKDSKTNSAELGYWLGEEYWGNKYMSEAATAILHYGFNHLNYKEINADVFDDNPASRRILEKLGMHYNGPATPDPDSVNQPRAASTFKKTKSEHVAQPDGL